MARYRDRHGDELYRTGVGGPRSSSSEPGPLRLHVLARRTFRPLHATHSCSRESQQPPKFDGSLRSVHPPVPRLISPAGVTDPSSSFVSFPRRARLSVPAANLEFRITYRHTVRESLVRDHGQLSSSPCAQPARCTKVLSHSDIFRASHAACAPTRRSVPSFRRGLGRLVHATRPHFYLRSISAIATARDRAAAAWHTYSPQRSDSQSLQPEATLMCDHDICELRRLFPIEEPRYRDDAR